MESVLLLVNGAPSSPNAQRAWQIAQTLRDQGNRVTLFLIQDGVLAARKGESALHDLGDLACYALGEDLQLRGFAASNLREQVKIADYGRLVDLFDQHERVIGAL